MPALYCFSKVQLSCTGADTLYYGDNVNGPGKFGISVPSVNGKVATELSYDAGLVNVLHGSVVPS